MNNEVTTQRSKTPQEEFDYWFEQGREARKKDDQNGTSHAKLVGLSIGPPIESRPPSLSELIRDGTVTVAGNGMYATCRNCGKTVKLNKFFLGSLHICT